MRVKKIGAILAGAVMIGSAVAAAGNPILVHIGWIMMLVRGAVMLTSIAIAYWVCRKLITVKRLTTILRSIWLFCGAANVKRVLNRACTMRNDVKEISRYW